VGNPSMDRKAPGIERRRGRDFETERRKQGVTSLQPTVCSMQKAKGNRQQAEEFFLSNLRVLSM